MEPGKIAPGQGRGRGRVHGNDRGRGRGGGKMSRKQMTKVADMKRIRELPTNEARYEMSEIESLEGGRQTRVDLGGLIQSKARKQVIKSKLQDIVGADAFIEEDIYVFELDVGCISSSLCKIPCVEFLGLHDYISETGNDFYAEDDSENDGDSFVEYDVPETTTFLNESAIISQTSKTQIQPKPHATETVHHKADSVLETLLQSTDSVPNTRAAFLQVTPIAAPTEPGPSIFDSVKQDVDSFLDDL